MVHGAATATQGIGQIVNSAVGSAVLREDNIVKTGVQAVGGAIGGQTGAAVAGFAYDAAVIIVNGYAFRRKCIRRSGNGHNAKSTIFK